ncbi:chorismate mutase [Actinocorallia longicatena]
MERRGSHDHAATPDPEKITTVAEARELIDAVDAQLAVLLERRAALSAAVQRLKPVGGYPGRSPGREREIVEAMSAHAPRLGPERLALIMSAVIEAGLDAAAEDRSRA